MIWAIRRDRGELVEELGEELVAWGEAIRGLFDELLPDDGTLKPDDLEPHRTEKDLDLTFLDPAPTKQARLFRDKNGLVMACILCGKHLTVDGRYCIRHQGYL